LSESKGQNTH